MLDVTRHNAFFCPTVFDYPVHVIGCGGLGSRMVEGLTRLGLGIKDVNPIYLYDDDTFEPHNVANQWIDSSHVGKIKSHRIKYNALKINPDCDITSYCQRVEAFVPMSGVVIVCVDSMVARRVIMERVIQENEHIECVIEMRMDAGTGISHCFDPHDEFQNECWWLYWHSDEEVENMRGCGDPESIISTINGTSMLAMKQLEQFARAGDTFNINANRLYFDFLEMECEKECWNPVDED